MNKRNLIVFTIIFFITIGFAAVNTVLDIKENINISENLDDFKIEITNLIINNVDKKNLIAKDKESFTFIGSGSDSIKYTVTNYSYQYDAKINLICNPSDDVTVNQINNLEAQSKKSETITSTSTNEIICTLSIEKVSRTEYAEDMCTYKEGNIWTFEYTGTEQEFTVPCDGEYKIELWGAQGGGNTSSGLGGYVKGNINILKNEILYVYVGNKPLLTEDSFNGGGKTNNTHYPTDDGGGATDIRLVGASWSEFESLKTRIIVAGAGGGAVEIIQNGSEGGAAGGIFAYDGANTTSQSYTEGYALGAMQISGGQGDNVGLKGRHPGMDGSFGIGGNGDLSYGGGAGGGGYYGGGGGGNYHLVSSGGGGSSFISGHNGCDAIAESSTQTNIIHTGQSNHYSGYIFKDTVMIDGAGYNWTNVKGSYTGMPSHDGKSTMSGNSGNGYAKITYLGS